MVKDTLSGCCKTLKGEFVGQLQTLDFAGIPSTLIVRSDSIASAAVSSKYVQPGPS